MIRIGMIGTENSHAYAFSKIINAPEDPGGKRYPDVEVVGVYGPDLDSAQRIVAEAGAKFVADSPEEFFGKVDAMFVHCRKGSLHYQYALPFIEKGMPVFIDKPFTSDVAQAQALVAAARKSGSPLYGGSGCKLSYDVLMLKHRVATLRKSGEFITASMNFSADPESIYDGFFFYSPHLTEMALTIFGQDVQSVKALEKNGTRIVIARYADFDVTLNYTKDSSATSALLFAKSGNTYREIDGSLSYEHEVEATIGMLRTGKMPIPFEELVRPVELISAIEKSLKTGEEVKV